MDQQKRQSVVKKITYVVITSILLLTVGIASFFFWIDRNLKQLNEQTSEYNQIRLEIEKIQSQFDSQAKDRKKSFFKRTQRERFKEISKTCCRKKSKNLSNDSKGNGAFYCSALC